MIMLDSSFNDFNCSNIEIYSLNSNWEYTQETSKLDDVL